MNEYYEGKVSFLYIYKRNTYGANVIPVSYFQSFSLLFHMIDSAKCSLARTTDSSVRSKKYELYGNR